jgi:hypothetical protein
MADLKHVGRVKATNKKCVVVFRTLPGDAFNCLVAPTENLPDAYHDALINLVESQAGQNANEFGEVMARSNFPDGSVMLAALHTQQRLVKVSTDQITMTPNGVVNVLLSELNQIIAEQMGTTVDALALRSAVAQDPKPADPKVTVQDVATVQEVPASTQTSQPTSFDTPEAEAKFYRSQADKLSKEAAEMRRKAETLSPTKKAK